MPGTNSLDRFVEAQTLSYKTALAEIRRGMDQYAVLVFRDQNLTLREQLDFTASYDFGNGIEVFGEAKNLTDSAGVKYYGTRERTYEYEKFGFNVFMGVRFKY